jgi:hypothetical protein
LCFPAKKLRFVHQVRTTDNLFKNHVVLEVHDFLRNCKIQKREKKYQTNKKQTKQRKKDKKVMKFFCMLLIAAKLLPLS